jgi:hypothetical protein
VNVTPLLLCRQRLANRQTPEKLRYDLIVKSFGELATLPVMPSVPAAMEASHNLSENTQAEWRRAVAEELLLRQNIGKEIPDEWLHTFAEIIPFDAESAKLSTLLRQPAACCMFPLATDSATPGAGHAWAFTDESHKLITSLPRKDWRGDSWQLAKAMAKMAMDSGDPGTIEKLATDWIATGTCDGDSIGPVELGNKLELDTARNWIIPAALTPREMKTRGQIFRAANMQSAYNIITGHGYQDIDQQQIPCPVDVMHSFVSDSRLPLLLTALATRPKTLQLWHSESFRALSEIISKELIPAFLPDCKINPPLPISSSSLADIEKTLRHNFMQEPNTNHTIIFSITNGNLIQRLAAASVANSFPHIQLVYRDIDAKGTNLTTISYITFPPTTCYNASSSIDSSRINIPFLTDREDRKLSTKELISKLIPEKQPDRSLTSSKTRNQQP